MTLVRRRPVAVTRDGCRRCAQAMALLDLLWPDYDYLPRLAARIALAGRHWHLTR